MKLQTISKLFGVAAALWLCGGSLLAQDNNGGGPGGPGGNFDPAKFEERMLERVRQNLTITNDEEWTAVQPLVQKVMQARRETGGMGMGPGGPPPGGGQGGPPPNDAQNGSDRPRRFGPPASAEQQTLQKALTDNASLPQIKDALAKYRAARKEKQSKLEAAQADLKSVLTSRQEAQAVLMGLLP
jgi:hypothetical protein